MMPLVTKKKPLKIKSCKITTVILFLSLILTSGCVLQSRQLDSLIKLFQPPTASFAENIWSLRYSDYESVVYAVSTNQGVLFSNQEGDLVLFDGWTVRELRGMGPRKINISIRDNGNYRIFKSGVRESRRHRCDKWVKQVNLDLVRLIQDCSSNQTYKNSILVKDNGDISMIRQIVDERYTPLTLTKLH